MLLSTIFTLSYFLVFVVVPLFLKGLKGFKKFEKLKKEAFQKSQHKTVVVVFGRPGVRGARARAGVWARGCGRVAALVRV